MITNKQFHYSQFFEDRGIYEGLFEAHEYPWQSLSAIEDFILNFKNSPQIQDYKEIDENVYVGNNVEIDSTAKIKGSAIIGHNSVIGHAAFLRGGVLLGEGVNVGHATEIKHSIVLSNTALAHLNYVGDSLIGSNCNISGGVIVANWRFDNKDIVIKNEGEGIETHLQKMGCVMGDGSFIGVNAVINPGTILASRSLVFPLISVKGTHLSQQVIK